MERAIKAIEERAAARLAAAEELLRGVCRMLLESLIRADKMKKRALGIQACRTQGSLPY
jgi:hypothetical protein